MGKTVTISGGTKLKAALKEISKKASKAAVLKVGFIGGAAYPTGQTVATIAAIQEFGAPAAGIPPRPYFRTMVTAKKGTWGKDLGHVLVAADYQSDKALEYMGERIGGQLQDSIIELDEPALSPVTLMLRQMFPQMKTYDKTGKDVAEARARVAAGERATGVSTKPLVWTGFMLNSVAYVVDEARHEMPPQGTAT